VKLVYDAAKRRMVARVAFDLQPERVLTKNEPRTGELPELLRQAFSEAGMRVVLESSSFLTGAKNLSIVYTPGSKPVAVTREGDAQVLPSQGGGLEGLTASLSDVADKVNKIPFEQIGANLNKTMESFQHLAGQADANVGPAMAQLPAIADQMSQAAARMNGALGEGGYGQNSEFQHGMTRLVNQFNDAARSVRVLVDYLDRHPEALIRGRATQGGER
jgi:paraquat-inducible protein B